MLAAGPTFHEVKIISGVLHHLSYHYNIINHSQYILLITTITHQQHLHVYHSLHTTTTILPTTWMVLRWQGMVFQTILYYHYVSIHIRQRASQSSQYPQ